MSSCHSDYAPKKREFQRIALPVKTYHPFRTNCEFSFDLPQYALAVPDTADPKAEPCWYNIEYPEFRATLHLSYKRFSGNKKELNALINDQRTLVYKHTVKADEITEEPFRFENGNTGIIYELFGNTATWYQFFITDQQNHYLRGALYFNARTDADSVAPVFQFLKSDATHLIQTLKWAQ
jgi:gliding motility-associated lipoprotein GldD